MGVLLLIGTRKGLFLVRGDDERRSFELEGPLLAGWQINHAVVDPRDGALYACANSWVYGGTVQRSTDLGKTWTRSEGLGLPEESGLKLASTWHLEPGHASEPGTLWLGGEPAALFRSDDSGRDLAGERRRARPRDPREVDARRRRVDHALDHAGSRRPAATVDRDLGCGRLPDRGRRRDLAARERGHGGVLPAGGSLPRGRAVRAQGARPPRQAGAAVAAEPLRRLPLGRPRGKLGTARGERASVGIRVRSRARSERSRPRVRHSRGGCREPRDVRWATRDLHDG